MKESEYPKTGKGWKNIVLSKDSIPILAKKASDSNLRGYS